MKRLSAAFLLLVSSLAFADTPAPGTVAIRGGTDGTKVGNTGDSLHVFVTGGGGGGTVNQGTGGASAWLITGTVGATQSGTWTTGRTWSLLNSTDSVNAVQSGTWTVQQGGAPWSVSQSGTWTTGRTWTLSSGTDSVTIAGTVTSTNASIGSNGVTAPASSTQIGGQDGSGNLQPLQVDGSKNLKTVIQNIPAVSQSGTWTVQQGTPPWSVSQSGAWTTGRTWTLLNTTDSVNVGNFPSTFGVTQSTSPWIISGTVAATQSGAWTTGRTWTLLNTTDSVNVGNFPATQAVTQSTSPWVVSGTVAATQSGAWTTGRTWSLLNSTDSVNAVQSGTWTVQQGSAPWSVSQSGTWTTGRTWTLASGTDSVAAVQSGTWTVQQGSAPWSVSQSGAWTVTANIGTTNGLALDATVSGLQVSQGSTTSGQKGDLIQAAVTTNDPGYSNGQTSPVTVNTRGGLRIVPTGMDNAGTPIRNDYSSNNVTTAAYFQLVASTSSEIHRLHIFDSSGQDFVLATGGAGSEVDQIQIPPGGWDSPVDLFIASGTRISIKSKSATASSGILLITELK